MAKNSSIHLWDNSWHVSEPAEGQKDYFGRTPKPLKKDSNDDICLRALSASSIGELMDSDGCEVFVWPNSINKGNEGLKAQYIFQVTENNGKDINSVTTGNVMGFIGKDTGKKQTNIRIHSRFTSSNDNDFFLYYMLEKVLAINAFSLSSSGKEPEVFDFLLFFFPKLLKGFVAGRL